MGGIIWTTSIFVIILLSPYFLYFSLYGFTLLKSLYNRNWKTAKNTLQDFAKLTPEQRMELEVKRVVKETLNENKPEEPKSSWLDSPSPKQAIEINAQQTRKEGERPAPTWDVATPEPTIPPLAKLP